MDGQNTNWDVFELLTQNYTNSLNLASCSLHVVHVALGNGSEASRWNVEKILKWTC